MDDRWRKRYGRQLELATPKQWAALVPREVLEEVARGSGGDQRDGKLPAPVHFWLLVAGALCGTCPSLASLIALFEKRFGYVEGFRLILFPVEASLPRYSPGTEYYRVNR